MADQIGDNESESNIKPEAHHNEEQATDNAKLKRQLNNWANERSRKEEKRVRSHIVTAMITDL